MSLERNEWITCPKCNNRQQVTVWESLNVTLNPKLREGLLTGKVNSFQCEACGSAARIESPLLYHDMRRRFCVRFIPFRMIGDTDVLEQFSSDGEPVIDEDYDEDEVEFSDYIFRPHLVFDLDELIRYVAFREAVNPHAKNCE